MQKKRDDAGAAETAAPLYRRGTFLIGLVLGSLGVPSCGGAVTGPMMSGGLADLPRRASPRKPPLHYLAGALKEMRLDTIMRCSEDGCHVEPAVAARSEAPAARLPAAPPPPPPTQIRSIAAIVPCSYLTPVKTPSGTLTGYRVTPDRSRTLEDICEEKTLPVVGKKHPEISEGSAFVYGNRRTVMTANHVGNSGNLSGHHVVFGFYTGTDGQLLDADGARREILRPEEVAVPMQVLTGNGKYADWALIALDRDAPGEPLGSCKSLPPTPLEDEETYLLGCPLGQGVHHTYGGKVRYGGSGTISMDIDAFEGNSGSAVFSRKTGKVVGVFLEGIADVTQGQCKPIVKCAPGACDAEEAYPITSVCAELQDGKYDTASNITPCPR